MVGKVGAYMLKFASTFIHDRQKRFQTRNQHDKINQDLFSVTWYLTSRALWNGAVHTRWEVGLEGLSLIFVFFFTDSAKLGGTMKIFPPLSAAGNKDLKSDEFLVLEENLSC